MLSGCIRAAIVRQSLRVCRASSQTRTQAILRVGFYSTLDENPIPMSPYSELDTPLRNVRSSTILPINLNNKTLYVPLPDLDLQANVIWAEVDDGRAPFLNRFQILYDMLNAAFVNWADKAPKQVYAIQTMNRGSGKTRLQIEWIYQALNNPKIINSFLETDPELQARKKTFINVLYDTVYRQRIILVTGDYLEHVPTTKPASVLVEIIKKNIVDRFSGCKIEFGGKTITITENFKLKLSPPRFVHLFNRLIENLTDKPSFLPYGEPEYAIDHAKPLLVLGLDECQVYSRRGTGKLRQDLVYQLLATTTQLRPSWSVCPFWVVTGTIIPGHYVTARNATSFTPITASMDNLLRARYLNTIAKQYFGKELPSFTYNRKLAGNEKLLHPNTAKALVCLFYRAFGLPRALEMMIRAAKSTIDAMEEANQNTNKTSYWTTDHLLRQARLRLDFGETMSQFHMDLQKAFPETNMAEMLTTLKKHAREQDLPIINKAIHLLDLKSVFCLKQTISDPIPHLGITPKELEESAYLVQWKKISETEKCYTRPFLLNYDDVDKPLELLKYQATNSDYWTPFDISLSTLILHPNIVSYLDDGLTIGTLFEHVTAASLYARYVILKETGPKEINVNVKLEDILSLPTTEGLPHFLTQATVNWKGVAILNQGVNSNSQKIFDEIEQKQVITVDSKSSPFADVIVPITINGEAAFIGIQTKQRRGQLTSDKVVQNAVNVLTHNKFYYVVLAPQPPTQSELSKALLPRLEMSKVTKLSNKQIAAHLTNQILLNNENLKGLFAKETNITIKETVDKQNQDLMQLVQKLLLDVKSEEQSNFSTNDTSRIASLPAKAVVSPIFQSYFGFAPIFGDDHLAMTDDVEDFDANFMARINEIKK